VLLQVCVEDRLEKLAMADGDGELTLPTHAIVTIDPQSHGKQTLNPS